MNLTIFIMIIFLIINLGGKNMNKCFNNKQEAFIMHE